MVSFGEAVVRVEIFEKMAGMEIALAQILEPEESEVLEKEEQ